MAHQYMPKIFIDPHKNFHFYKGSKRFILSVIGSPANNVVSIVKKEYGFLVHSL